MVKQRCIRLFLVGLFLSFSSALLAQSIHGKVYDKRSGEALIGADILIENLNLKKSTGLDGSFQFQKLPQGSYTLLVHHLNYKTTRLSIQLTKEDNPLRLTVELEEENSQLDEVTVHGVRSGFSEESARHRERNASQVLNALSGKAIQLSPDLTVANAVQRISGVSLERNSNGDGQHAILRGMDKRYNYTLVNGVKIPSPDNKYRYVPLDIFPSELLDRLEVFKSLTPDMEGDAIGGVINMVMKDAPTRKQLSFNIATGYNQLFLDRDFTSFDYHKVDKQSPAERYGKNHVATDKDFGNATSLYKNSRPAPNQILGFSLGDRFFANRFGIIVAGSYQNTYRGSNSVFFDERREGDTQASTLTNRSERQFSEQQKRLGLHAKLDFRINEKNKLQWYNAYLNFTNAQVREIESFGLQFGGYDPEKGNATMAFSTRARLTQQSIINSTLQGEHLLTERLSTEWSLVYANANNEQPDNTTVALVGEMKNFERIPVYASNGRRRWEHNSDRDLYGSVNLKYKSEIAGLPIDWKIGGMYRDKQRKNFYNEHIMRVPSPQPLYGIDFQTYDQIKWSFGGPAYASPLTYDAWEKIGAGYALFQLNTAAIEATGGLRAEHTQQGYNMLYVTVLPNGDQKYVDLLPSLNVKYKLKENVNLRASYYKAINRPGFFEIVPYSIVNEEYNERGNPDLKRAIAHNYDVRYELFPSSTEQLLVGAFYKHIKNPIEYTLQADAIRGQDIFYFPGNFGFADNVGFEVDFMKYFNKIGVRANYTYTHSAITTDKSKRIRNDKGDFELINVKQTRPLFGQSAHTGNLSLLYKDTKTGWDAQLNANYTGKRIITVAQFVDADHWQRGFVQLDAAIEKKFAKRYVIFLKANNLLNTPMEVYQKGNPTNVEHITDQKRDGRTLIQKDFYQRTLLLGFRFEL